MVNTIWKETFLIMCSHLKGNARYSGRFPPVLRITEDYTLQTLCGSPHNICNDEGKLNGMPLNRAIFDKNGRVQDIIAGNMIICRAPADSEDFASLTQGQAKKYLERFRMPEVFINTPEGIMVTRMRVVNLKDHEIER
ncbi:MAG: DUF3846 domain-containing protein [Anaerovoracaceae bacterium]